MEGWMSRVLVTGGSGFLGSYCILRLLNAGHAVATTIRGSHREKDVRSMIRRGGASGDAKIDFFHANLESDAGWSDAVKDIDFVLHVASPFGGPQPKHEDDIVVPAREGTLRVLWAASKADVKRVVLTSSFGAIGYGHKPRREPFTESDWTDITQSDVQPYIKSKTVAERAAWDFVEHDDSEMELTVVNPVGIFGPVLGPNFSSSVHIMRAMLAGEMPFAPRIYFGLVDVRDVADLHLRAMTSPKAAGERFLAVAGEPLSMLEVARILRRELGERALRAPSRQIPDALVHVLSLLSPRMRQLVPQVGKRRRASNSKARSLLDWSPRPNEEIIAATGHSLLALQDEAGSAKLG